MDVGYFSGNRGSMRGGARSVSSVAADLGFGKFSGSIGGPFSGVGAGSHGGSSAAQDETISAMIANLLRMGPSNNGFQQSFITSAFNIPVSVISPPPCVPLFLHHPNQQWLQASTKQPSQHKICPGYV